MREVKGGTTRMQEVAKYLRELADAVAKAQAVEFTLRQEQEEVDINFCGESYPARMYGGNPSTEISLRIHPKPDKVKERERKRLERKKAADAKKVKKLLVEARKLGWSGPDSAEDTEW